MNHKNIENRLFQLGANWPVASVAESVRARISSQPTPRAAASRPARWRLAFAGLALTLLVAVLLPLALFGTPPTLYAQVKESLKKARAAHVTIAILDEKAGRRTAEMWYARERGFRAESPDEVIVDDGKRQWSWSPKAKGAETIVASRASRDAVSMIAGALQLEKIPADWRRERSAEHDREVRGQRCEALVVEPSNQQSLSEDASEIVRDPNPVRIIVWLDREKRIVQVEEQRRVDLEWRSRREMSIEYDVEIPLAKFAANFPKEAKIVDVDRAWDGRFPLDKSLATAESGGLLFAVHELQRGEDDMFYIVSSVRGTPEHLKKFPPKSRRLNLQTTILDVAEQAASPGTDGEHHRATLTSAESQGVHYLWWMSVRRKYFSVKDGERTPHGEGPSLETEPGRVRIPLLARYRDPRAGNDWVSANVQVTLPADARPEALVEIAARVHRDASLLGPGEYLALHGAVKDNRLQFLRDPNIRDADFARELSQQLEWLRTHDEVSDGKSAPPGGMPGRP